MIVNDYACVLTKHVSFKSIASKLAPTEDCVTPVDAVGVGTAESCDLLMFS